MLQGPDSLEMPLAAQHTAHPPFHPLSGKSSQHHHQETPSTLFVLDHCQSWSNIWLHEKGSAMLNPIHCAFPISASTSWQLAVLSGSTPAGWTASLFSPLPHSLSLASHREWFFLRTYSNLSLCLSVMLDTVAWTFCGAPTARERTRLRMQCAMHPLWCSISKVVALQCIAWLPNRKRDMPQISRTQFDNSPSRFDPLRNGTVTTAYQYE
ncbi:hypothetical protein BD289DRAFT_426434 [Coniella lustricola]|uniref:Uncharacterized protein n=1 Tax=Coniella lustricola TaxID=2025994 RepID=A0A2T3AG22_9PEZI|nr:hypothetical protein BD289DRAFT_426434 [Coniella lustricola]